MAVTLTSPVVAKPGFPIPRFPPAVPVVPVYKPVTADQLREIMPDARAHADDYVDLPPLEG